MHSNMLKPLICIHKHHAFSFFVFSENEQIPFKTQTTKTYFSTTNKQANKKTKTTVEPPKLYKINKFSFSSKIPSLIEKSPPLTATCIWSKTCLNEFIYAPHPHFSKLPLLSRVEWVLFMCSWGNCLSGNRWSCRNRLHCRGHTHATHTQTNELIKELF